MWSLAVWLNWTQRAGDQSRGRPVGEWRDGRRMEEGGVLCMKGISEWVRVVRYDG